MTFPIVDITVTPGNIPGTYGIGCTPQFDAETRLLIVGPGVFRLSKSPEESSGGIDLADELVFPGGEVTLPEDTLEVWVVRHRSSGKATLLVNVGRGVDNFIHEPCYVIYLFGTAHRGDSEPMERFPAHILHHWRCIPRDRQRWTVTKYKSPPENMEDFRGEPAAVVIQSEIPDHVQASIGRQEAARTALHALSILARTPAEKWTDGQMRCALADLIKANPDIEVPEDLL